MYILDLTNPLVLLAALMIYLLCIILGKEFKNSTLPGISLVLFIGTLGIYGLQLFLSGDSEANRIITTCIIYNTILVFLSYISYLWIDTIEAKEKNIKSIDDSLDWFWKKV